MKEQGTQAPATNKPVPIDNTELVREFRNRGGCLLHVRPERIYGGGWTRGMTVAFMQKSGRIELATSVSHRSDSFTKKIGTKTAIEHFNAGKTIFFPIRGKKVVQDLQAALSCIC